jgi:membrane associated rhomboid family serine protease
MFFPISDDNPSKTLPLITYILIGICVFVFFLQILSEMNPVIYYNFGFIASNFFNSNSFVDAFIPVITSMFVHGGFAHIIGNLLYLWIFGDNVEDSMGRARFVLFYILCGASGAILQGYRRPYLKYTNGWR